MKSLFHLALCMASISMSGCTSLYRGYAVPDLKIDAKSSYMMLVKQLQATPTPDNPYLPAACFQVPVDSGNAVSCQQKRNAAISALILSSEQLCVNHRKTIYGNDATWNITTGTFTNLFAGAATITTGTHAKSLYSALALLSNSERSLVNETVYKSVIVPVVDKKIMQSRDTRARAIYGSFNKTANEFSADQALREVVTFHYSCSFMDGLRLALEEGVQETARQKANRLGAALALINAEVAGISVTDRTAPPQGTGLKKAQYDALIARHKSLSDEITILEKQ